MSASTADLPRCTACGEEIGWDAARLMIGQDQYHATCRQPTCWEVAALARELAEVLDAAKGAIAHAQRLNPRDYDPIAVRTSAALAKARDAGLIP